MGTELNRQQCLKLLTAKADILNRMPIKSDFSIYEVMKIKAYFGPWPRALEAAGLKDRVDSGRQDRNREKHIRAAVRKTQGKLNKEEVRDERNYEETD